MRIDKFIQCDMAMALSLRKKEMKTKELVLGFCVLTAVTGAVSQIFGDTEMELASLDDDEGPLVFVDEAVTGAAPLRFLHGAVAGAGSAGWLDNVIEDRVFQEVLALRQSEMLFAAIPDSERKAAYAKALDALKQRLNAETKEFAKMCYKEAECARIAVLCDRRAYFHYKTGVRDLELINKKSTRIQSDLVKAKKSVKWALLPSTKKKTKAKVDALKLELADALWQRKLVLEQVAISRSAATGYLNAARQFMNDASELHTQRIACITRLNEAEVRRFLENKKSIVDYIKRVRSDDIAIPELEAIALEAIQCVAVFQEAYRRWREAVRITNCTMVTIQWPNDFNWFRNVIGGDRRLYNELQTSFSQETRCCVYSESSTIGHMINSIQLVFGDAVSLADETCARLQAIRAAADSAAVDTATV
jgi:hypothetical protein